MASSFSRPTRSRTHLTRIVALSVAFIALLLLCVSAFYLNQFRQQRLDAQRNQLILSAWQEQLLTATPAAISRELLKDELRAAQQRFSQASGLLPGVDLELAVLQRIQEAIELSGVELTSLKQKGTPFHEGALVGSHYAISVVGDLERVTDFAIRLEEEAFPAAYFAEDAILNATKDDQYVFAGTLTVYGSTLSTGSLTDERLLKQPMEGAEFRERAQQALRFGDHELALSLLLQYAALEPESTEVDSLLYETYVQYGNHMLAQGHDELAKEQCEAAQQLNPNGPEALACLVAVGQQPTVTTDALAMNGQTATAQNGGSNGNSDSGSNGSSDGGSDGGSNGTSSATATTTTGTPNPLVSTPTPDPLVDTPTPDPLVDTPTPDPLVDTPTPDPLVDTPTPDPLGSAPTADPLAGTATADPLAGTATADPLAGTATAEPLAGTATADPLAGTATPKATAKPTTKPKATPTTTEKSSPSVPNTAIPTIKAPQTRTPGLPATTVPTAPAAPTAPTATITKISATVTPISSGESKGPSLPPTIDNPSPTGTPTTGSSNPPSLPNTPVSSNTPIPSNTAPTEAPSNTTPTKRPDNTAPTEVPPSNTPTTAVAPTVAPTVTPSSTPTAAVAPTVAPTVTPSNTPTAAVAPTVAPTVTPSSTPTAGVAPTVGPNNTPVSATATATDRVEATATATNGSNPTATTTVSPISGLAFVANAPFYLPNCGLTHIKGTIRAQGSNTPIRGITVRVSFDGAAVDEIYSNPSDTNGEWDVVLADYARAGKWYVQVIDRATRIGLSERQTVFTDTGPCKPGESGHQAVIQDFVYRAGPGTPVPTAGPTNTPTITPTPSNTPTPTTTPSPTVTVSPTVMPSPTGTPVQLVFAKDEIPDLFIPDGPSSAAATSTIVVPDDIILRQMRINISLHDPNDSTIQDLDIDLIHPDGTSIRLHAEGEGALARWIDLTGGDLARFEGKSAQGAWTLKLVDRFEGNTCRLASWQIEIYP